MHWLIKALVALIIGAVVAFIVNKVLVHIGGVTDPGFWAWLVGVVVGVVYFFYGNWPNNEVRP